MIKIKYLPILLFFYLFQNSILYAAPVVSITSPINGIYYRAGDVITCTGFATDATDGTLTGSSLKWKIDGRHDDHTHDLLFNGIGNKLIITIPLAGELSANVYLTIKLSATNSLNEETTESISVFPLISNLTVTSVPTGAVIGIGLSANLKIATPAVFGSTEKLFWNVNTAVNQTVNGEALVFSHFTDTSYRYFTFGFQTPVSDTLFTAFFINQDTLNAFSAKDSVYANVNVDTTISIPIPSGIMWNLATNVDWIEPKKMYGNPDEPVVLKLSTIDFVHDRWAEITITGGGYIKSTKILKIVQFADTLNLSESELFFSPNEFNNTITVSSNTKWSAESDASWMKISTTTGIGNTQLVITVDTNKTNIDRADIITFKGVSRTRYLVVRQSSVLAIETEIEPIIKISPNPFEEFINIKIPNGKTFIQVNNALAVKLKTFESIVTTGEMQINLSEFAKGLYYIDIITENNRQTFKIVKN